MLFRTFLPSWKFFDDVSFVPQMYYRVAHTGGSFGPWVACLNPPVRKWYHFFLNPHGNLFLAHRTLVERLVREVNALEESSGVSAQFEKSVSYQLVRELARVEALSAGVASPFRFQFKIAVLVSPSRSGSSNKHEEARISADEEEVLISTEHEA